MDNLTAHYRTLADYDALVPPVEALIKYFELGQLEHWYLKQVHRRTYMTVTGTSLVNIASTSGGSVYRQRLPPRPTYPPTPRHPPADEWGRREPPTARRVSMLNIIRRIRPVSLAVQAARAVYMQQALVQYDQQKSRAADPVAALASRLKACAEHLLGQRSGLEVAAKGQTGEVVHERSDLPNGGRYYHPLGWPLARVATLAGEMLLFHKLRADFQAAVQALTIVPAAHEVPRPPGLSAWGTGGLIRKYYPSLGQHFTLPTVAELAAEWFLALALRGTEDMNHYVADRHEAASNKAEFLDCLAALLAEAEQYAHLPGYGLPDNLPPQRASELEASGRAVLRAVREWHTLASLTPIEQFLHRARKIELWHNERHQLATREARREEWNEEYGVMLLALQRAVPSVKKKLLRAAYTELKRLLPTIEASQPLEWQRLADEGRPFFPIILKNTYIYSEFAPLRPTQNTERQATESFFVNLYLHLFEKEWHVWQALILLAGALGEAAPPTPETFRERQTKPAPAIAKPSQPNSLALDTPTAPAIAEPPQPLTERLPIDDVLAMPRAALDLILLDAAMIEPDTIPGRYKAKPTAKPWQWANVRAALQTKFLLAEINDGDAALLFTETYGAKVGRGTMQKRPQNEQNSKFKTRRIVAYAEFRDRLPAPNPS